MPQPLTLILKPDERQTLELMRDTDPHPYLRERAAALLKIADLGRPQTARQVALQGLLRRHQPDTVYGWIKRFRTEGLAGLHIKPGRGRKPAFSPSRAEQGKCPRKPSAPHSPRPT